mmetsp:Transcript_84908/g.226567  ORF Transcript_84908/g.226567 Transcript_84908/m.226567 type:complete len:276 (-) Transcript_84908:2833-3660(-)
MERELDASPATVRRHVGSPVPVGSETIASECEVALQRKSLLADEAEKVESVLGSANTTVDTITGADDARRFVSSPRMELGREVRPAGGGSAYDVCGSVLIDVYGLPRAAAAATAKAQFPATAFRSALSLAASSFLSNSSPPTLDVRALSAALRLPGLRLRLCEPPRLAGERRRPGEADRRFLGDPPPDPRAPSASTTGATGALFPPAGTPRRPVVSIGAAPATADIRLNRPVSPVIDTTEPRFLLPAVLAPACPHAVIVSNAFAVIGGGASSSSS